MTSNRLRLFVFISLLAVPGIAVARLLEHNGYAGWTQLAAQFATTWICLLVLLRRELPSLLRRKSTPRDPPPLDPDSP